MTVSDLNNTPPNEYYNGYEDLIEKLYKYFKKRKYAKLIIQDIIFDNREYGDRLKVGDITYAIKLDMSVYYAANPKVDSQEIVVEQILDGTFVNNFDTFKHLCFPSKEISDLAGFIYFVTADGFSGYNPNASTPKGIKKHKEAVDHVLSVCRANHELAMKLSKKL